MAGESAAAAACQLLGRGVSCCEASLASFCSVARDSVSCSGEARRDHRPPAWSPPSRREAPSGRREECRHVARAGRGTAWRR